MVAGTPTISVDRLVGKYWSSIDVNTDAISDFYESLPIDNKIPLDECHIHFSGLAKLLDGSVYKGACAYESGAIAKIDSVAPTESDIVIFLGSSLKWGEADEDVDHVVAHELTHFAAKQSTNPS